MIKVLSNWPYLFEEIEQSADMVVGVLKETSEDLHHACIQALLIGRTIVPRFDIGVMAGKLCIGRNNAYLLLSSEDLSR